MGSIVEFMIKIDNPSNVFTPGQTITGEVVLKIGSPLTIKGRYELFAMGVKN